MGHGLLDTKLLGQRFLDGAAGGIDILGAVEETYEVATGKSVQAGQVVDLVGGYLVPGFRRKWIRQSSVHDTGAGVANTRMVRLTETRSILLRGSWARAIGHSDTEISLLDVNASAGYNVYSLARIDNTRCIFGSTAAHIRVIQLDTGDDSLSVGTAVSLGLGATLQSVVMLTDSLGLTIYSRTSYVVFARCFTVSGTTITLRGSETTVRDFGTDIIRATALCRVSDDGAASLCSAGGSTSVTVRLLSVDGSYNISVATARTCNLGSSPRNLAIRRLPGVTRALASGVGNGFPRIAICNWVDSETSPGVSAPFWMNTSVEGPLLLIDDNTFAFASSGQSGSGSGTNFLWGASLFLGEMDISTPDLLDKNNAYTNSFRNSDSLAIIRRHANDVEVFKACLEYINESKGLILLGYSSDDATQRYHLLLLSCPIIGVGIALQDGAAGNTVKVAAFRGAA